MTVLMGSRSVSALIREAMDRIEDPDPRAVAMVVIDQVTDEQAREFALRGIAEDVRALMSVRRRGGGQTRSAAWAEVARQNETGELDLARLSVYTGVEHKWLLDCSADDLRAAQGEIERQRSSLAQIAKSYECIAELLQRKRGAKVVGDLPVEKVREALNA